MLITSTSEGIKLHNRTGTWYVISDCETDSGKRYYLVESEQHGSDAAAIVLDEDGKEICETWDSLRIALEDEGIIDSYGCYDYNGDYDCDYDDDFDDDD
jgi:hypothetical protein